MFILSSWIEKEELIKAGIIPKHPGEVEGRINRIESINQMRKDVQLMKQSFEPNSKHNGHINSKTKKKKQKDIPKQFSSVFWLEYADAKD